MIPAEPSAELELLAAEATKAFDPFRAPLSPEDRARRNPDRPTPRQRDYLDRWGYPYVFEEFRFHMTLTGRLPAERREPVVAMLRERFAATGVGTACGRRDCPVPSGKSEFAVSRHWPLAIAGVTGRRTRLKISKTTPCKSRIGTQNGPT